MVVPLRAEGIEPSTQAWEAHVLPLNHAREHWAGRKSKAAFRSWQGESLWSGTLSFRPSTYGGVESGKVILSEGAIVVDRIRLFVDEAAGDPLVEISELFILCAIPVH